MKFNKKIILVLSLAAAGLFYSCKKEDDRDQWLVKDKTEESSTPPTDGGNSGDGDGNGDDGLDNGDNNDNGNLDQGKCTLDFAPAYNLQRTFGRSMIIPDGVKIIEVFNDSIVVVSKLKGDFREVTAGNYTSLLPFTAAVYSTNQSLKNVDSDYETLWWRFANNYSLAGYNGLKMLRDGVSAVVLGRQAADQYDYPQFNSHGISLDMSNGIIVMNGDYITVIAGAKVLLNTVPKRPVCGMDGGIKQSQENFQLECGDEDMVYDPSKPNFSGIENRKMTCDPTLPLTEWKSVVGGWVKSVFTKGERK